MTTPSGAGGCSTWPIPFDDGVTVNDNWDTLGMRGTASNDVEVDNVFVPDERVLADRPYGVLDPPLQVIVSIAMPIIAAVYLGVAESAAAAAIDAVGSTNDPLQQRLVGLMQTDCASPAGPSTALCGRWATIRSRRWRPWPM